MIKSGKNESFCEDMVKALITKRTKSGKNESFCEGMVKAFFFEKLKKVSKRVPKIGVNLAVAWLPKSGLNALFFSGFFGTLKSPQKIPRRVQATVSPMIINPITLGNPGGGVVGGGAERRLRR